MVRFETGDEQKYSRFFTKLHPDVRREIFLHLFGSSHVHVMFTSSYEMNNRKFWRHGRPPLTHVGWLHCVCKSGAKRLPHEHDEDIHKWRYLSTNILRTCRRAYEEGIALLYHTNTFLFEKSIDVINFNTLAIDHLCFIRSLELHITIDRPTSVRQETDAFRLAVSMLSDKSTWQYLKLVKLRVFDDLDNAPPKRQRKKIRKDIQREFGRAVRALVEDGRIEAQVILNNRGDKEIIQPRFHQPGLTFVNLSQEQRWCMLWPGEEEDDDSDEAEAFHCVARALEPCMPSP
ncbi:hypothetical protein LCI18_012420 [Fusarium solani-melongenae]|uniref:Uncharacterized protein n=1 Tax=Fusarium solani subsp. cucurbitae TaxID=2747967 RepID=A0ACD3ZK65_FUSSC|nr:hypothetical protein LCI18_012420 [Fusarium solani-melongenae]